MESIHNEMVLCYLYEMGFFKKVPWRILERGGTSFYFKLLQSSDSIYNISNNTWIV